MIDAGEHRRLEPVAGALDALAADLELRALGERVADLLLEHRELRRACQRTDVAAVGRRIADLEALHGRDEVIDEGVVDPLVDVDPLDRAAALAGVVHRAVGERLGGGLRVGVVGDVGRILAAELELQPDHARAASRAAIFAPVATEPVKNTPSTRCSSSAAPTSPAPTTVMKTSSGMPAACSRRSMCRPVRVANSDGL